MGYYNVIQACVVGKLHYATPTTQPIEVDDGTAAPLVESGHLQPYNPGGIACKTGTALDGAIQDALSRASTEAGEDFAEAMDPRPEPSPRRNRRRTAES